MPASSPTAYVTEVPGRYAPAYVKNRANPGGITTSTGTTSVDAFLPRFEQQGINFNVPLTTIEEIGTNFHVGEMDDLPENKVSFTGYDVGLTNAALLCGKQILGVGNTTTIGFNDLSNAIVDLTKQYADPNGNVFYTEYMDNLFIEEYAISLKAKSMAMETFAFVGDNLLGFRGIIQTKAYVVQAADVTANSFAVTSLLGAGEAIVPVPVPTGPASYWIQRGSLNFLKVERYRAATGWVRLPETSGTVSKGFVKFTTPNLAVAAGSGDLVAGDLFFLTYCTYTTAVTALKTIYQTTPDTSDPIAIPTRLAALSISAGTISRGQSLDIKMSLKRDRAEGIGDTSALYGPPAAPDLTISLDVKRTDNSLNTLFQTGQTLGTDNGGTVAGDFFDPLAVTRNQLATNVPVVATLSDPRTVGVVLKTITCPTAVFSGYDISDSVKSPMTVKYNGKDKVGNMTIAVTK